MNRAELLALADRVEGLTAADRMIEGEIMKALYPGLVWEQFSDTWCSRDIDDPVGWVAPPPFTASLNAAVSLVQDGWTTKLAMEDRHSRSWSWALRGGLSVERRARAATQALAITAAALRAKVEEVGDDR